MAPTTRGGASVAVCLAPPSDRRPLLAAGFARPRLRRDRGPDLQHRRLARFLCRPGIPDAGPLPRAVAHPHRRLGPFLAARRVSRPEPGRAPRDRALLRPPPRRRRQRLGRRAPGRLVRARVPAARAVPTRAPGSLAGSIRLPPSHDDATSVGFGGGSVLTTDAPDVGVD